MLYRNKKIVKILMSISFRSKRLLWGLSKLDQKMAVYQVLQFLPHIHHCETKHLDHGGLVHFVGRFNHHISKSMIKQGIEGGPFYSLIFDHHGDIGLTLCLDGMDRQAPYVLDIQIADVIDWLNKVSEMHHHDHPYDHSFEQAGVPFPKIITKIFGFYHPDVHPIVMDKAGIPMQHSESPILNNDIVDAQKTVRLTPEAKGHVLRVLVCFKEHGHSDETKGSIMISRS